MAAEIWKNGGNHSAADTSGGAWLRSVQKKRKRPCRSLPRTSVRHKAEKIPGAATHKVLTQIHRLYII